MTWLAGLATGLASGLAQGFSGAGSGNWGSADGGGYGGGYGAVTVARVNVAPVAGGLTGPVGPAGGGGGLFGVTRPTPMAEANAVAAQFFGSAGVPVATPAGANPIATPRAVVSWGWQRQPGNPGNRIARPTVILASPAVSRPAPQAAPADAPVEPPPFAPRGQLATVRPEQTGPATAR